MIDALPVLPLYRAGDVLHATLHEAAENLGAVTANPTHALPQRPSGNATSALLKRAKELQMGFFARPTLLHEVESVPHEMSPAIRELLTRTAGEAPIEVDVLAGKCVTVLQEYIEAAWDPKAKHVVLFSSGYDTRLLTALLKICHVRRPGWLGEIRFCAFQPEIGYAKRIFDYLGWSEDFWWPIDASAPAVDYYADCLDFDVAGRLCEAERLWAGPLLTQLRLAADGYLDGNVQGFCALFGDETLKWNRLRQGPLGVLLACYFWDSPGVMHQRPDIEFVMPFTNVEWLELLTRYRIPIPLDEFKKRMIAQIDPKLAELPNFRFTEGEIRRASPGGHIDQQLISPHTAHKIQKAYQASWYARTIGPRTLDLSGLAIPYWSDHGTHYFKAAIYEQIIKSGVKLEHTQHGTSR